MLKLTVLDDIRIEAPCRASWDDMKGDDRSRSCLSCACTVHDLSALTTDEAIALTAPPEAQVCLRIHRKADGTVVTRDTPVAGKNPKWHAWALAMGIVGLTTLALTMDTSAFGSDPSRLGPIVGPTLRGWIDWAYEKAGSSPIRPTITLGKPAMRPVGTSCLLPPPAIPGQ